MEIDLNARSDIVLNMSAVLRLSTLPAALRTLAEQGAFIAPAQPEAPASWSRAELAGRLVELSGAAAGAEMTLAALALLDAQREGEATAWIALGGALPYPPDLQAVGVDLAALPVILAPDPGAAGRAADSLLRSGAFGLIILDLADAPPMPMPLQARLTQLARNHGAGLLCLTRKGEDDPSLSSLVALRLHARCRRVGEDRFECAVQAVKDKRRGPGWRWAEICHGPPGLR